VDVSDALDGFRHGYLPLCYVARYFYVTIARKSAGSKRVRMVAGLELSAVGFFTEEYPLGAVGGAAGGCGFYTEDYLLGAVGGAACGSERA
jgi:hypothetical protein